MECCKCEATINIKDDNLPAQWFGLYRGRALVRVICADCSKKPENKEWWT